jgi:hypothetical protein
MDGVFIRKMGDAGRMGWMPYEPQLANSGFPPNFFFMVSFHDKTTSRT